MAGWYDHPESGCAAVYAGANFATEITQETIENLFEVQNFPGIRKRHTTRRFWHTDEDIVQIREAIQAMSVAIDDPESDSESLTRSSHAFHLRVITAAKNPVLENLYRSLYDLLEISKQYTMRPESVSDSTLMDHEAILL